MKLIFFGTPDYVIPVLDALKDAGYDVAAVVTQPPKPVGRKKVLTPSPVAQWAKTNRIEVIDKSPKEIPPLLTNHQSPTTFGILAAYGRLVPQEVIDAFPKGIINVHPSLLPKYRGASPVEAAIVAGEKETGITIIKLDAEMDHGPVLAQFTEPIRKDDTRVTLRKRLFDKAASVLVKVLPQYLEGKTQLREQNHEKATFTTLMKKEMGFIPPEYLASALKGVPFQAQWEIPFIKNYSLVPNAQCLERFIRAVNPWPGAWTNVKLEAGSKKLEVKRVKILKVHLEPSNIKPQTSNFKLDLVQLEGKNPVSWKQFKEGYPNAVLAEN